MPIISCWTKIRTRAGVAIGAVILISTLVGAPSLEAQDLPSIVGSSPLSGLTGGTGWINSAPLTAKQLKGKVFLVDFWDYS